MNRLKFVLGLSIIIGTIGVALNILFKTTVIPFIQQENIQGFTLYKYEYWDYIENIRINILDPTELQLSWQNLTWENPTGSIIEEQFWNAILNNMGYMVNILIFALNLLIYPIRIACYVGRTLLSLFGIPITTTTPIGWLIQTINFLIRLQIPYI